MTTIEYRATYDRIAHDHIAHWQATGCNPFQDPKVIKANEDETVRLIGEGSILDVGCGMGDLLMRFPDRERHGIDISEEYLEIARGRGLDVMLAEAEAIPFPDDSFDVVVATDILEHVLNLKRVAAEIVRVARRQLVVRVPEEYDIDIDPTYGSVHLRLFNKRSLRRLFAGCKVHECFLAGGSIYLSCSP